VYLSLNRKAAYLLVSAMKLDVTGSAADSVFGIILPEPIFA
jgi:hypothetical protein